jgi:hypothetical protein
MKVTFNEVDATCKTAGCTNLNVKIRVLMDPNGYVECGACAKKVTDTKFIKTVTLDLQ